MDEEGKKKVCEWAVLSRNCWSLVWFIEEASGVRPWFLSGFLDLKQLLLGSGGASSSRQASPEWPLHPFSPSPWFLDSRSVHMRLVGVSLMLVNLVFLL